MNHHMRRFRPLPSSAYFILFNLISVIACLVLPASLAAEPAPGTAYFKVIDANSGLPDNSVNALAEDSLGFMWIGTWNGLARYDGHQSQIYKHDENDPASLVNNMVRALAVYKGGIFVGTDRGLDYLDCNSGVFKHSWLRREGPEGSKLLRMRFSRLCVMGDRLFALNVDGDILRLVDGSTDTDRPVFDKLSLPANRRYADITPFADGKLFALSNEGISVLSPDGERVLLHNPIKDNFDSNMNLYFDPVEGIVYLGGGIGKTGTAYRLSGTDGALVQDPAIEVPASLMATTGNDEFIYHASDGTGLYAHHRGGDVTTYNPDNSSLPGDALYSLYLDRGQNLWCGTYRRGLCFLSPELNRFTLNGKANGALSYDIVTSIVTDNDRIYVGLDGGGLDIFDRETGRSTNFNKSNSGLPGNNIVSILKDGRRLWLAIYATDLTCFDLDTHAVRTYPLRPEREAGKKLWVLHDAGAGKLWVGGHSLQIFDKATGEFSDVPGCNDLDVMSIGDDGQYIWVGTRLLGVLQIDKRTHRIVSRISSRPDASITIPESNVDYLYVDPAGTVWFTIPGYGVFSMKKKGQERELHNYSVADGLTEPRVCAIAAAGDGDLWMGTDNGLFLFNRSKNSFTRYNDPRLPSGYTYNASTVYGGDIYFGTTEGMLSFPRANVGRDNTERPTVFTGVRPIGDSGRTRHMLGSIVPPVKLGSDENFFTISFTVPETINPDRVVLQYQLEGFDNDWRMADDSRTATYTNVPPGSYRFLVRHKTSDGAWTDPVAMELTISFPWFLSWWAIILWMILLGGGIYAIIHFWHRYNSSRASAQLALMKSEQQSQLNDAKLDFYANIAHELRTPCFLITAQIEDILDNPKAPMRTSNLQAIYRNSLKLNRLINHVIDFRKIDSGLLRIRPRKLELTSFIAGLVPDYQNLAAQKGLDFEYRHDDPPVEGIFDPDKLELIITNLISNAFKYTRRDEGVITLSLRDLGDEVEISVSDTGIGILPELRERIFMPYYRTERGMRESSGDGIGLAYVKELVDLHHGNISLTSEVNVGSTFTVTLPKELTGAADKGADESHPDVAPRLPVPVAPVEDTPEINDPTATRSLLVIDDEPEVCELLARTFRGEYRVDTVKDPQEGLDKALTGNYDVVITDLMMPGVDGLQIINEIKSHKELSHVRIVVLTASNGELDMLHALDAGVAVYLNKPISLKVLKAQIDRLFTPDGSVHADAQLTPGTKYSREEQKFLRECRRIIEENLLEEDFGIEMLARKLAMSHSSLYKKIRSMTGMSLVEFINEYRICKAVAFFRQGNSNVQNVSELCGFRDIKTFRESFKRKMGMPPKQYIQSLNK